MVKKILTQIQYIESLLPKDCEDYEKLEQIQLTLQKIKKEVEELDANNGE